MKRRIILPDWVKNQALEVKKQTEDILHLKKRIEGVEARPITPITPAATTGPKLRDDNVQHATPPTMLGPHRKQLPGTHQRKSIHAPTLSFESKIIEIESK